MSFIILYAFGIILLSLKIYQTIKDNYLNNNLLFLILTNIILNITVGVYGYCWQNLIFSFISCLALLIAAFFLNKELKKIYLKYSLCLVPYLLIIFYAFIKISKNLFIYLFF